MQFTVLGSGTSVPDPDRGPAGFLLRVDDRSWLVDGGSGTLQRCAQAGVDPRALDGGFYTHRHPDHCADLVPLLFAMRVGVPPRTRDYPIWAGAGFHEYFEALRGVFGSWIDFPAAVRIHELSLAVPEVIELGALTVRTAPANHSAGALHLRFEAHGRAVVFSGDTGPSPALSRLAAGADLLVCECAAREDESYAGHLNALEVRDLVREARPVAVWLTHFYPGVDAARAVATVSDAGVPVRRAEDGDTWDG